MLSKYQQKGIVTLATLLLLSSLLILLLIFDDKILSSYSFISWQYQKTLKQNIELQQQISEEAIKKCQLLTLNQAEDIIQIVFKSKVKIEPLTQKVWCERKKLFKRQPTKSHYISQLSNYINLDVLKYFQSKFPQVESFKQGDKSAKLYFFSKNNNHWEIDGDHYAVALAEGSLYIEGKGKLYGSVITMGNLHMADTVKLVYNKQVIIKLMQKYRYWQKAERSWYDVD